MERVLAFARLVRRQVRSERLWKAARPAYWKLVSGMTRRRGLAMQLSDGHRYRLDARLYAWQPELYEPPVVSRLLAELRPGSVFWDIGAHVGLITLMAARALDDGGQVCAFEPSPSNATLLRRHLVANGLASRVAVHEVLVGERCSDAVGCAYRPGECTANSLAYEIEGAASAHVRMVTIDQMVSSQLCPPPDVLKIDVEGYEHHVLSGGRAVLKEYAPIVICAIHPEPLNQLGSSPADVLDEMRKLGYQACDLNGAPISTAGFEEIVFRKPR